MIYWECILLMVICHASQMMVVILAVASHLHSIAEWGEVVTRAGFFLVGEAILGLVQIDRQRLRPLVGAGPTQPQKGLN